MSKYGFEASIDCAVLGEATPYTMVFYHRDNRLLSVTRARLMRGDAITKEHNYERPVTQEMAQDNLRSVLGAQVALDKARGEAYAQSFNYIRWQSEREKNKQQRAAWRKT